MGGRLGFGLPVVVSEQTPPRPFDLDRWLMHRPGMTDWCWWGCVAQVVGVTDLLLLARGFLVVGFTFQSQVRGWTERTRGEPANNNRSQNRSTSRLIMTIFFTLLSLAHMILSTFDSQVFIQSSDLHGNVDHPIGV